MVSEFNKISSPRIHDRVTRSSLRLEIAKYFLFFRDFEGRLFHEFRVR